MLAPGSNPTMLLQQPGQIGQLRRALRAVAANPASRLFALDLGKQPHRENHEEPEECDDILKAVMPECMLEIGGNGGDENDEE
jgi:hypothetical protein